jgi:hypothetical protein
MTVVGVVRQSRLKPGGRNSIVSIAVIGVNYSEEATDYVSILYGDSIPGDE